MKTTLKTTVSPVARKRRAWALFTGACLLLLAANAFADIDVARHWAGTPPSIDGTFTPGEWNGATVTPLAGGQMRTKNNGQYLFMLLDFTADTTEDPVPTTPDPYGGDYFVLAVDTDRNSSVTADVDFNYSACQDGREFIKAYYKTASSYTGCRETSALSAGKYGFGATAASSTPHRFYEFRLDLTELGIDPATWTTSAGEMAKVRMHVSLVSQTPHLLSGQPQNKIFPNLANSFYLIDLATYPGYPAGSTGPTFAGVGMVPSTYINALGNANLNIADYYAATDAPFGGKLNIFGNWKRLRTVDHARSYRVWYHNGAVWQMLLQTWTNFYFDSGSGKWVPTSIGPNADGKYQIPSPSTLWYLPNLLISWQSGQVPDGFYRLRLELFDAAGRRLPAPDGNLLKLNVVNTAPIPTINEVTYEGETVPACAIITQGADPAGFNFDVSVTDARGALNAFALTAIHGNNLSESIYQDNYSGHVGESGPGKWNGVSNLIVPVGSKWRASETCAYSFILSASSRSQNGYGLIYPYVGYHVSLTILEGAPVKTITPCGPPAGAEESSGGCKPAGVQ